MKIYCSGIGGIGLSAYASLQQVAGHQVMGSDRATSALIEDLETQGIHVFLDQSGAALPEDIDLFVYSEAIPKEAPERKRAQELGITQLSYPEAVGEISKGKKLICVCGSHGKSSTTAMAARLLINAGLDPTIIVGTKLRELGERNWRVGASDIFLLEACEYRRSFLHYSPHLILLTNADGDHYDYYNSHNDYLMAFSEFVEKLPQDGVLITHEGDSNCKTIADLTEHTVLDADTEPMITLKTPGEHMRKNAQLVLALAGIMGVLPEQAAQWVSEYAGSWRRMEVKAELADGITVIDDYAHHPVEIRATLAALKEAYAGRRIVCVFQPHTHDRTLKLWNDFLHAFGDANLVIMTTVYDARHDTETGTVDLQKFVNDVSTGSGVEVQNGGSLKDVQHVLPGILHANDVLVCMGAGDITNLAATFVA